MPGRTETDANECESVAIGLDTLATGQSSPFGLAIDDTFVYWTDTGAGAVRKVPKCGGGHSTVLAQGQDDALGLQVDSTKLYWILPHAIVGVAKDGGVHVCLGKGR
jgi:hypothetical protein